MAQAVASGKVGVNRYATGRQQAPNCASTKKREGAPADHSGAPTRSARYK
jgi:hypothetical protein